MVKLFQFETRRHGLLHDRRLSLRHKLFYIQSFSTLSFLSRAQQKQGVACPASWRIFCRVIAQFNSTFQKHGSSARYMTTQPSSEPLSLRPTGYIRTCEVNPRIHSVVMHIRARYGAIRILGIGQGAQPLCHDLHQAGFHAVGIESDGSNATPINHSARRRLIDSSPIKDAPFDMVISIELGQPFSMPSMLIKLASLKLQPGGVFILSIPYSGYLKNLLLTMRDWLTPPFFTPWDDGYIQRWSKKCLTTLLEAYGFTVVELIGVRNPSLQWESLILVARKTSDPISPAPHPH